MNRLLSLALFASSLAMVAAGPAPAVIRFANKSGDQLAGTLQAITSDQVVWNSPTLAKPTPFWLKHVLDLALPATYPEFSATHEVTLTLTNGNTVRGQIAAVTDDTITLDTWYAGRLKFRRVMVKEVAVEARPSLIFSGPTGLDGWIQSPKSPTWTYEHGSLHTTAKQGIGRNVSLPDACSIGFDVAWRDGLMLNFDFFSDDAASGNPGCGYQMSCVGASVNIRRHDAGMSLGDAANVPELKENEKVRLEVRASRASGNLCLYVNGRYAALWKDPGAAKAKSGKSIRFEPRGDTSLRISAIKVSEWDGIMEELPDENAAMFGWRMGGQRIQNGQLLQMGNANEDEPKPEPKPKPKPATDGRMLLRNGDSIGGEVVSILDGFISIKTEFAEVKLPVARVRNIILKPAALEEPIRRNGDVRAWFGDGSVMVFRLESLTKDSITGHSQTFGTATFKLDAFNRIEFNIYDPNIIDMRAKHDW
jgi:hypothetical protein